VRVVALVAVAAGVAPDFDDVSDAVDGAGADADDGVAAGTGACARLDRGTQARLIAIV